LSKSPRRRYTSSAQNTRNRLLHFIGDLQDIEFRGKLILRQEQRHGRRAEIEGVSPVRGPGAQTGNALSSLIELHLGLLNTLQGER